jgi:hypothetical protein
MREGAVSLGGLEIHQTSPILLAIVGLHVAFGIAAVFAGAAAMLVRKGRGSHSRRGTTYYWCLAGTVVSAAPLAIVRWSEDLPVSALGIVGLGAATFGRIALQRRWPGWARLHVLGMGLSYILLLTAFYVENGSSLPLWDRLPTIAYWLMPSAIGAPIIALTLLRHPLAR